MNQTNLISDNKAQDVTANIIGAKMFIAKLVTKENRKQLQHYKQASLSVSSYEYCTCTKLYQGTRL